MGAQGRQCSAVPGGSNHPVTALPGALSSFRSPPLTAERVTGCESFFCGLMVAQQTLQCFGFLLVCFPGRINVNDKQAGS